MKTLILFMLVSFQAFTQSMIFHQKVNSVLVFKVTELSDDMESTIFKFSNQREVTPIKVNDNKEWVGIKPNGFKYNATVPFVFNDGWATVVEFNVFNKKYVDHFYGDLLVYNP